MEQIEQQEKTIRRIVEAACDCVGISQEDFLSVKRNGKLDIIRGVCYLLSREFQIHPRITAKVVKRSRCNVITMSGKYMRCLGKDKQASELYNAVCRRLLADYCHISSD